LCTRGASIAPSRASNMGLTGLWQQLSQSFVTRTADDGELGTIVEDLSGQVLALDLSLLVFQALMQRELADKTNLSEQARVAKLTMERCSNLLRFGVTPVGVTDGRPPLEKFEKLQRRNGMTGEYRCVSAAAGCAAGSHKSSI
jgi:XPG N-terminal domain